VAAYGQVSVGLTASGFVNKTRYVNVTTPGNTAFTIGELADRPSFSIGGFSQLDHTSWLSTRLEINYTNTGFWMQNRDMGGSVYPTFKNTFHYGQASPMIGARVKRGFGLFTGPTLNAHLGSVSRGQIVERDEQGLVTPTGKWLDIPNGYLEENSPNFGSVKPFVLGWQVQLGYSYKRFSIHIRRQWQLQPMGSRAFTGVSNSNNLFYFRSWQYGLSYALFQSKSKGNQLKPDSQ